MHRLTLATRNAHKTREFAEILGAEFLLTDLSNVTGLPAVAESGDTFEENAILKVVAASRVLPGLVVSDDSGLEVAALRGAPGVRSARYAGDNATDQENIAKLLSDLRGVAPMECDRHASFSCTLALAEAGEPLRLFHGTVNGLIVEVPHGKKGFGYDSIFTPEGYSETFGELGAGVKRQISHRARAIAELRKYLKD